MSLLEVAAAYYATQQAIARAAELAAQRQWRAGIQFDDLNGSWSSLADRLLVTVAGAQLLAAQQADPYLDAAVAEQGEDPDPAGQVAPRALSGVASNGGALDYLLFLAVIRVKQALSQAEPRARALARGEAHLLGVVGTQVQDAGRAATGVAIAARPQVRGWVRMVNPPACSRCVILGGKYFRWNQGFRRHPKCDCQHIPAVEDDLDDIRTDPKAYFRSLSEADQDKYFGKAAAEAIRGGADMNRVVNATGRASGLSRPGATPVRGARVMPEAIADATGDDRGERIRRLRDAGFLI